MPESIFASQRTRGVLPRTLVVQNQTRGCNSYHSVLDKLRGLPDPPAGHKRVFRGQYRDFGGMIPSGLRVGSTRPEDIGEKILRGLRWELPLPNTIWSSYARLILNQLRQEAPSRDRRRDLDIMMFGIEAISQHYGPGTRFLDVTRSPSVALWFALNRQVTFDIPRSSQRPEDQPIEQDLFLHPTLTSYVPWTRGVLYVLDVPEWDGINRPKHGQLIDLAKRAPDIFGSSDRIRVQEACLIAADPDIRDLRNFYAIDPPIVVERPMLDAPWLNEPTWKIFPGPTRDKWYKRFLSIPLVDKPDDRGVELKTDRAVPVTLYYQKDKEDLVQLMGSLYIQRSLDLLLARAEASGSSAEINATLADWLNILPADGRLQMRNSTPIILEAPLLAPWGMEMWSGFWNVGLLGFDVSESVETSILRDGSVGGQMSLESVFLEFSPLDWPLLEMPWTVENHFLKSAWLIRNRNRFFLQAFLQSFPDRELKILKPRYYEFGATGRFERWSPEEPQRTVAQATDIYDQVFFITLNILRKLSPCVKVSPVPSCQREIPGVLCQYGLEIERGAFLRLARVMDSRGRNWYVLRTVKGNQVFAPQVFESVELTEKHALLSSGATYSSSNPWSEISAASLRLAAQENPREGTDAGAPLD